MQLVKRVWKMMAGMVMVSLACGAAAAGEVEAKPERVTVDNFNRAASDLYFSRFVQQGGFGKFSHERELAPIDKQRVVRLNRDTLYSFGVFDMSAGPVTVTLPDTGKRFMSLQVINEDYYAPNVYYAPGTFAIQFGGCDSKTPNCLPIMPGWNYTVRMYRPRAAILDGS